MSTIEVSHNAVYVPLKDFLVSFLLLKVEARTKGT